MITTLEYAKKCVGDGWAELVERCWNICQSTSPPVEVIQIKEKFGGLRFYTGCATKEIFDSIMEIEQESYEICEVCGKEGTIRDTGWIKTLCDEHYREYTSRRESRK